MDLWIRSQNKKTLHKVTKVYISEHQYYGGRIIYRIIDSSDVLGIYETEERALEVLDEIQKSICTTFNLKPKIPLCNDELEAVKVYLEDLNDIKLITAGIEFEIEPISTNTFVYQMPEK